MTHRRLRGLSQQQLAEQAGVSHDLISKIEIGASGARFPNIEKIARALSVDPAQLFSAEASGANFRGGVYGDILTTLSSLNEHDLVWLKSVIDASLGKRPR